MRCCGVAVIFERNGVKLLGKVVGPSSARDIVNKPLGNMKSLFTFTHRTFHYFTDKTYLLRARRGFEGVDVDSTGYFGGRVWGFYSALQSNNCCTEF